MKYYSNKARMSAIQSIHECIEKIGHIKASELSYTDAREITNLLSTLEEYIKSEDKENQ